MGRNFIQRLVTGILFIAIIIVGIIYGPVSFAIVFTLITAFAILEFGHLVNQIEGVKINRAITMLGGIFLFLAFFGYNIIGMRIFIPYLIIVIYLIVSELYLKRENPVNNWAYSMLSQMYIALPFAMLNVPAFHSDPVSEIIEYNPILPLSIFVFLWLSDTGAYCVGSLIGKHRLFERISPKKSWEGSIGGGVVTIASSFAFAHFFPFLSLTGWIGLAATVVVFGTWGDLAESLFKRQLGVKDSGRVLPGHGGVLDRFDSAFLAIPAAVVYLYLLYL